MSLFPMNPTQQIDWPVKKDTAVPSICAYDERKVNVSAIELFIKLDGRQSPIYREKTVRETLAAFGVNDRRAIARVLWLASEHASNGEEFKRLYNQVLRGAIHAQNTGLHRMEVA